MVYLFFSPPLFVLQMRFPTPLKFHSSVLHTSLCFRLFSPSALSPGTLLLHPERHHRIAILWPRALSNVLQSFEVLCPNTSFDPLPTRDIKSYFATYTPPVIGPCFLEPAILPSPAPLLTPALLPFLFSIFRISYFPRCPDSLLRGFNRPRCASVLLHLEVVLSFFPSLIASFRERDQANSRATGGQ